MKDRIYKLREDDIPGVDGEVSAIHRWGLPGLDCSTCGQTWACSGVELPSVDLSSLDEFRDKDALQVEKPNVWPVDNEKFERLANLVRPLLPADVALVPGLEFGPLIGRATGPFADFLSPTLFTFLARTHVVAELEAAKIDITTVKTELEFEQSRFEDLYEFEILPLVHVYVPDEVLAKRCLRCRRIGATVPERLTVYGDTWPEGAHLVRAIELPTVVFCSARFRDVVFENGWLGIRFEEVEVTNSRIRRRQ